MPLRDRLRLDFWCEGRVFAIPKASSPEHARGNAGAGKLQLTKAELDESNEAFPLAPGHRRLPML